MPWQRPVELLQVSRIFLDTINSTTASPQVISQFTHGARVAYALWMSFHSMMQA